jgi:hypothetical protein
MQKVNYIHMNPVRAGVVERAVEIPLVEFKDLAGMSDRG